MFLLLYHTWLVGLALFWVLWRIFFFFPLLISVARVVIGGGQDWEWMVRMYFCFQWDEMKRADAT